MYKLTFDHAATIFDPQTDAEKNMVWCMQFGAEKWDFTHVVIYARALQRKGCALKPSERV